MLPKGEDSKLNCSACAGKSYYHKVDCPRREEAMQLKETMKFLRQAEREERAAKGASSGEGSEAKKAKLMEVEVTPESQAADEDMDPGHRGEDESPDKKQRVEHTLSHVTGDSEVEDLATNEQMETYIECDGTYWDEDDGEQLEPSQVQAGIEREVKQMRELDVAEVRRRDEVPEGVRVWSGRWCYRKKAGGVHSRYVVRQYRTEWSEDAFCGTPGWGGHSPSSCSGVSHALDGDAWGFLDGVHAHAPTGLRRVLDRAAEGGRARQALRVEAQEGA